MTSFILENVSVPPEVEAAIDKRSSMAAVGNLNDYVKFQMAQGMETGGAGVGGIGAEMAVGMADGAADDEPARRRHGAGHAGRGAAAAAPAACPRRSARPTPPRRSACPKPTSSRASKPAISRARDRHAVADHAGGARRLPEVTSTSRDRARNPASDDGVGRPRAQKFHCPACGAEAHWNPAKQALICPFCGTESPASCEPAAPTTVIVEHDLVAALREHSRLARAAGRREKTSVRCQSCQAISVFDADKVGQRCEFCGSAPLVPYEQVKDAFRPESLLPLRSPSRRRAI